MKRGRRQAGHKNTEPSADVVSASLLGGACHCQKENSGISATFERSTLRYASAMRGSIAMPNRCARRIVSRLAVRDCSIEGFHGGGRHLRKPGRGAHCSSARRAMDF